ncbi:MAG: hypothetical protein NVS3B5_06420 [Sphingomicrobium sp.]
MGHRPREAYRNELARCDAGCAELSSEQIGATLEFAERYLFPLVRNRNRIGVTGSNPGNALRDTGQRER